MARSLTLVLAAALAALDAHAVPCSTLPVLLVVQDKSGSMNELPDPSCTNCPTKWASASTAVSQLVNTYAFNFRFGLMMYPGTYGGCGAGAVVAPVPATAQSMTQAYASSPYGGTPTAATLVAARSYLQSLNLGTTKGYVLLITDGQPNCNSGLNAATCTPSHPTLCAGSNDPTCCLDDVQAKAAAGALFAAGFKVYVVGFGAGTTGNNKAVLDAIASAGGTGTAYSALNQAALTQALQAIGAQTATCCTNACTQGAKRCSPNGSLEECTLDAASGCTQWSAMTCPQGQSCTSGACQSCTQTCTPGTTRCAGTGLERCVTNASGCNLWERQPCPYAQTCTNGACQSCSTCTPGAATCTNGRLEQCVADALTGCTRLVTVTCPPGSECAQSTCRRCDTACSAGMKRCLGKQPEVCVADAKGCTSWQVAGAECGSFCSAGLCGECGASCTLGTRQCNGDMLEECRGDVNGCRSFQPLKACAANQRCLVGECRDPCGTGELEGCPANHTCVGPLGGRVCVPDALADAGQGPVPGPDAGSGNEQPRSDAGFASDLASGRGSRVGAGAGCGCGQAPGPLALGAALGLFLWRLSLGRSGRRRSP